MPTSELQHARKQLINAKKETAYHQKNINDVKFWLRCSDAMTQVALFCSISALTMGLASYFSSLSLIRAAGARVALRGAGLTPRLMSTNAAIRVIAGFGAGTTARLSFVQLAEAMTGIISRALATTAVATSTMCIRQKLKGGNIDRRFVTEELMAGVFFAVILSWVSAPGPKTEVKSALIKRLSKKLPSWRSALANPNPSNQLVVGAFSGTYKVYKSVVSEDCKLSVIKAAMKKEGFDFDAEVRKASQAVVSNMRLPTLESLVKVTTKARRFASRQDYSHLVSTVARIGHAWREYFGNDRRIDYRLKNAYTEMLVAKTAAAFWEGVVTFYECVEAAGEAGRK